jgi:hypothetical protein
VLGDLTESRERDWLTRVQHGTKPTLILEFWDENEMFKEAGPVSKRVSILWEEQGFATGCVDINSTQVGGVVDRRWLIVACYQKDDRGSPLEWPLVEQEVRRPM